MDLFTYQYPVRQHFGKGCAESAIKEEMTRVGKNVLLAYGGGSLKRTGLYDTLMEWLHNSRASGWCLRPILSAVSRARRHRSTGRRGRRQGHRLARQVRRHRK